MTKHLTPVEQKMVNFEGAEILGIKANDGKIYVGVSYICNGIGLTEGQRDRQVKNIQEDVVLKQGSKKLSVKFDGQVREVLVIELEFLPLWLAKISITPTMQKENPELVFRLVKYQLKAKDVLAQAFLTKQQPSYMIEDPITRAERWIEEQKEKRRIEAEHRQLQTKIEADKPKVLFAEAVTASKTSILVGELAKILKQNGIDIGQNRLFQWLRENGYLIRRQGTDYNMPTQKSMELGLFEIKETSVTHSDGHITISKTPKVTGKGQIYFINQFKTEFKAVN